MSSSRRTRRSYRRYDRRDEDDSCSGPINLLLYMMSACSAIVNMDSPRSSRKYNSYDDDETQVTEMSSHSSDKQRSGSKSRRDRSSTRTRSSSRTTRQRETPRARSHSVRPDHRSRSVERKVQERMRSRSFSTPHRQPIPDPLIPVHQDTVVQVKHDDDDRSAISAGTLDQRARVQILQTANKNLYRRKQQTPSPAPDPAAFVECSAVFKPVITMGSPDRSRDSAARSQSSQSSTGTSVFESVWNTTPNKSESSGRKNDEYGAKVDDYHLQGKRSSRTKSGSSSHRVSLEDTPNTRKMKRQIQRDWIGTIEERVYSDEEEI